LEISDSLLTIGAAPVVFTGGNLVLYARVADRDPVLWPQRQQLALQRTAIDQESISGSSEAGDELVHDSAASAGIFVFGLLTGECNLLALEST